MPSCFIFLFIFFFLPQLCVIMPFDSLFFWPDSAKVEILLGKRSFARVATCLNVSRFTILRLYFILIVTLIAGLSLVSC